MANPADLFDFAHEIAEIASKTRDGETAVQLVALLERLLTAAGLPAPVDKPRT